MCPEVNGLGLRGAWYNSEVILLRDFDEEPGSCDDDGTVGMREAQVWARATLFDHFDCDWIISGLGLGSVAVLETGASAIRRLFGG